MNKIEFLKTQLYLNKNKIEKLLSEINIKNFDEYKKLNKNNIDYKNEMLKIRILEYEKIDKII